MCEFRYTCDMKRFSLGRTPFLKKCAWCWISFQPYLTQEEQSKALYLAKVITWPSLPGFRVKTGGEYRELVWNGKGNKRFEGAVEGRYVSTLRPQSNVMTDPMNWQYPMLTSLSICWSYSLSVIKFKLCPAMWHSVKLLELAFQLMQAKSHLNPLKPELNPSAQRCLTRFLLGILLLEPCI
jgi:hypothetical protein